MNDKELEKIKNLTREKIAVSKFQEENFMKKDEKKNKMFLFRTITTIAACIMFFSIALFSRKISDKLYAIYNKNSIVEIAISNAHNAKFDSDYDASESEIINLNDENSKFSQDAIKFKVDEITMDDTSIDITFDIDCLEDITKDIKEDEEIQIEIADISITDENGNILYCQDKDKIYELLQIDIKSGDGYAEYMNDSYLENEKFFSSNLSSSYVCGYTKNDNGSSMKLVYSITFFEQNKYFPRSQKLNINFSNIKISSNEANWNLEGLWNIDLELPENVYSRQRTIYKEVGEEDTENKVLTFSVLSTWTEATLQLKASETAKGTGSPQLNLINAIEIGNPTTQIRDYFVDELMSSEEYKKYEEDLLKSYLIEDAYIEDEDGNKYGLTEEGFSNAGGDITDEGYYIPKLILNFKDTDMTESLKLHITYLDNEFVFDLVKDGEV